MKYETKRKLLHLLFPTRCPICGEIIDAMERFCGSCADKLNKYDGDFSVPDAADFTAPLLYDETTSPAIFLLKNGTRGNADFALGGELADKLLEKGTAEKIDVIIPIPMLKKDQKKRSYNQAELISNIVSRAIDKPVKNGILIKCRETQAQKTLNSEMRTLNVKNAYTVAAPDEVKGKSVLLIDDICTTGSTLSAAVKLLLQAEAKEVHCAVCCKTPKKQKK